MHFRCRTLTQTTILSLLTIAALALPPAANAAKWTIQTTPNPAGGTNSDLEDVSCASSTNCMAVGHYAKAVGTHYTLAEHWNGTEWKVESTPNPKESTWSQLQAVSCPSATKCIAAGYSGNGAAQTPLAEEWNGTEWKSLSTPESSGSRFESISCTSSTACTAVGANNPAGTETTLAWRWNGSKWSVQAPTNPGLTSSLAGVSCTSATACTAVGTYKNGEAVELALAEAWNGSEWKTQTTPNTVTSARLYMVSCVSTVCTADGYAGSRALIEHWTGTEWVVQLHPTEGGPSLLFGVSCPSSTACEAAGTTFAATPLAYGWNGTEWASQTIPTPEGASQSQLNGVSCTTSTSCTAVGNYVNSSKTEVTLAERYQ
jgi:hypothetical protein